MGMKVKVALGDPRPRRWGKAKDKRPWAVLYADGTEAARTWSKENAQALAKLKGDGAKAVKRKDQSAKAPS